MAKAQSSIFKRKGRRGYTLEWRGHQRTFATKREAEDEKDRLRMEERATRGLLPDLLLRDYEARWREHIKPHIKPQTRESYAWAMDLHVLPELGHLPLRDITRTHVKDFVAAKLEHLAKKTVAIIKGTLHTCLNEAIEDGYLGSNPAAIRGKSKTLRLRPTRAERSAKIKAFDVDQLAAFLAACRDVEPGRYVLFCTIALTGTRLGEALGLQVDDLDFKKRQISIARAIAGLEVDTPKSGDERTIDMAADLRDVLRQYVADIKASALKEGRPQPVWLFPSQAGTHLIRGRVEQAFKRVLKRASLPLHHSPHSLRHTFASLLLQQGESIYYVQRQLGHANIQLTVDTYGRWLPAGNPACVDRLAARLRRSTDKALTGSAAGSEEDP